MNVIQKKRVEIARALATEPELLLPDETMAGLTDAERKEAVEFIRSINNRVVTIITIEHVMDVLMAVSDRVVVINSGRLLMQGTPQEALFSIVFPAHFRYNTFGACFECVCIFRMLPTTGLTSTSAKASAASGVM